MRKKISTIFISLDGRINNDEADSLKIGHILEYSIKKGTFFQKPVDVLTIDVNREVI